MGPQGDRQEREHWAVGVLGSRQARDAQDAGREGGRSPGFARAQFWSGDQEGWSCCYLTWRRWNGERGVGAPLRTSC